jgi:hypothetical protein
MALPMAQGVNERPRQAPTLRRALMRLLARLLHTTVV